VGRTVFVLREWLTLAGITEILYLRRYCHQLAEETQNRAGLTLHAAHNEMNFT
jgi:hypothetical protein